MKSYILPGNYNEKDAKRLIRALRGKTFMEFDVEVCNYAGNYKIIISTQREGTTFNDLAEMVIFVLAQNIKEPIQGIVIARLGIDMHGREVFENLENGQIYKRYQGSGQLYTTDRFDGEPDIPLKDGLRITELVSYTHKREV